MKAPLSLPGGFPMSWISGGHRPARSGKSIWQPEMASIAANTCIACHKADNHLLS
jgi:hypothetical protein